MRLAAFVVVLLPATPAAAAAGPATKRVRIRQTQPVPPDRWGAPPVAGRQDGRTWTIAGRKQTVTLNARDLSMQIAAGPARWSMMPPRTGDLVVRTPSHKEAPMSLAAAKRAAVEPYDTGYKTGVKLTLSGWSNEP